MRHIEFSSLIIISFPIILNCTFYDNIDFLLYSFYSGMAASFTTILIQHYEENFKDFANPFSSNKAALVEAMIGTFQDIPPIVVSIIGGFLQQMFGPHKILIVSAIPSILSWILVVLGPSSIPCLLLSRICAGLAFGLLTGNIYLVQMASNSNIGSLKMVEVKT